jgi:hypothetical protein
MKSVVYGKVESLNLHLGRRIMRKFVFAAAMLMSGEAFAGCELISGPCWTQGRDTYTMERNSGGSYNTYRNGDPYSPTARKRAMAGNAANGQLPFD